MFKKSFCLVWDKFGYFLACIGLDVLFFFALGFFTAPVAFRMQELFLQITAVFSSALKNLSSEQAILEILFSSEIIPFWRSLLLYALLFVFIIYLIYVLFQSIAWNISLRIINKNIPYFRYLGFFAVINLFWFFVFIVYNLLDLLGDLRNVLGNSGDFGLISIFANFFLIIAVYFAVISYTVLKFKKSFVLGWKKYRVLLLNYFWVVLYFFVLNMFLSRLFFWNYNFAVVLGLFLFLPAVSWARVFMALNIEKVK